MLRQLICRRDAGHAEILVLGLLAEGAMIDVEVLNLSEVVEADTSADSSAFRLIHIACRLFIWILQTLQYLKGVFVFERREEIASLLRFCDCLTSLL